jgi:hypothetical protein
MRFAIVLLVLWVCVVGVGNAQTTEHRFEAGGHLHVLRLGDIDTTTAGFGGRLLFHLTDWIAIDGEVSLFPHDEIVGETTQTSIGPLRIDYERRRVHAVGGINLGVRGERMGLFVAAKPGITRLYNKRIECEGNGCALVLIAPVIYRTEFALDLGGGVEFYPSRRTIARVDVGDTIIRHRSIAPPCPSGCTSHNLSSRIGFGVRF